MNKIKIIGNDTSFEIPYEWILSEGLTDAMTDLEGSATRSTVTGKLYVTTIGMFPEFTISFKSGLTQGEIFPMLETFGIGADRKISITYFNAYKDTYYTMDCYVSRPSLVVKRYPDGTNTDDIEYASFELGLKPFERIS